MIKQNLTKDFSVNCDADHPYLYNICFDMADQVIKYLDFYIINRLKLIRIDDHRESYKDCKFGSEYLKTSYAPTRGIPLTRYYALNNNDTNFLILEVLVGKKSSEASGEQPNNTQLSNYTRANFAIQIQMYYSRECPVENLDTMVFSSDFNCNSPASYAELLKNSRIRWIQNPVYNNGVWTFHLPLQIIETSNLTCFTFNNSINAIPRIGNIQTKINNQTGTYKCFVNISNAWPEGGADWSRPEDSPKASNILFTDDEKYRYGVPKIIKNKTFYNLETKIPTLPLFLSSTDTTDPTQFSFYSTIEGFVQTSANFANNLGSRFDINGSSYLNIGEGLLLKE